MLQSMTGYGEDSRQQQELTVAIEVRAVNSRYLKIVVRSSEGYGSLDSLIESEVRRCVRRGTLQINVRAARTLSADDYRIDLELLANYHRQLTQWAKGEQLQSEIPIENLLVLPGIIKETSSLLVHAEADWPVIQETLLAALGKFQHMRTEEGRAMATDLRENCQRLVASLEKIEQRAPVVVEEYRSRLEGRIQRILSEYEIVLNPSDLIREISLFADRSDISEETVRLRSHLAQFESSLDLPASSGRKLEFLTQEMLRETNTIGSKANDVEIATEVIEMKTALERIREMIQNVE